MKKMRKSAALLALTLLLSGCGGAKQPSGAVTLAETKSDLEESYYTIAAELPLYTGEDADPALWETLQENWRAWDDQDEMSRLLSSVLPGSCSRSFDTWEACEEYLGITLDNPLEADWTKANESAIPLDTPALNGNGRHAKVSFYGNRDGELESVTVRTGYLDGTVRLALTAYLRCTEEPFTTRCLWAEQVRFETENVTLSDATQVLLISPEDSGNYCSTDAYFIREGGLYTLHAIGEKGEEASIRQTLDRALEAFGAK